MFSMPENPFVPIFMRCFEAEMAIICNSITVVCLLFGEMSKSSVSYNIGCGDSFSMLF